MGIKSTYCLTRHTAIEVIKDRLIDNLVNLGDYDIQCLLDFCNGHVSEYRNYMIVSDDIVTSKDPLLGGGPFIKSKDDF